MNEYVIYVSGEAADGDSPDDWREQITAHKGVTCRATNRGGMLVMCDEATSEKLKKKFPNLKIEYVLPIEKDE